MSFGDNEFKSECRFSRFSYLSNILFLNWVCTMRRINLLELMSDPSPILTSISVLDHPSSIIDVARGKACTPNLKHLRKTQNAVPYYDRNSARVGLSPDARSIFD